MALGKWAAVIAGAILGSLAFKNDHRTLFMKPAAPESLICIAIDGDTLSCSGRRIRLLGIDAAELPGHCRPGRRCAPGDPYAQREVLSRFVSSEVTIIPIKTDRYGRTVAIVQNASGDNASCVMIRAGARYVSEWDHQNQIAIACLASWMKQARPPTRVN